jgi:hypothetical protein
VQLNQNIDLHVLNTTRKKDEMSGIKPNCYDVNMIDVTIEDLAWLCSESDCCIRHLPAVLLSENLRI